MTNSTGEDYSPGPYSVRFPAGITSSFLYISITDDNILEGNEYFNILIDLSSLITGITVGNVDRATVTISDADSKQYMYLVMLKKHLYNYIT